MNPKTGILVVLGTLAILLAGLAHLSHQPDTIIVLTIPAWLRAGGAGVALGALVLWLQRDMWRALDEPLAAVSAWLDEEG